VVKTVQVTTSKARILRFGVFEVDLQTGELRKSGLKTKLQEKPFQILVLLLKRPGEVVTREELQKALWPTDTFVDFEHGVNTAIAKLRQALDDDPDNPRFIQTLPRRGYRFIGMVDPITESPPTSPGLVIPERQTLSRRFTRRQIVLAAVALAILATAILAKFDLLRLRRTTRTAPPHVESLAVLPLDNLSGNPADEYLVDGMTDALITNFSKIGALRVISRTSIMRYKGASRPLPEIGNELNVDAVVEGAVLRSDGRVRITAQLIDARTERPLWAETYERDLRDTLALQGEVAQAIANQVLIKVTPQEQVRLATVRPVSAEAQEAYLQGRYYWNRANSWNNPSTREDLDKALGYFQQAISNDPQYALAYAGVADCYIKMVDFVKLEPGKGYPQAKAAATQALAIDDTVGEAHNSLAMVLWVYEWAWSDAEREFKRAIELNPSNALAHAQYARYLSELGRTEEALVQVETARGIDPISLFVNTAKGYVLLNARQYDRAIEQFRKTLEMYPQATSPRFLLMSCYERKGMYDEAVAESLKGKESSGIKPEILKALRDAYAKDGVKGWRRKDMETAKVQGWASDCNFASLYALLGEKEQALEALEKAYQERSQARCQWFRTLKINPVFDTYRSDPRFQDLIRRVGFPP
jgi:TolB-like protein/DNA-binding winged helix-turn-helix (wHTH) protein/Tfp pilus assembly protein PilF